MALLDTHIWNNIPIHVYASSTDIGYTRKSKSIIMALDTALLDRDLYCLSVQCETCPFFSALGELCSPNFINFLYEHYSSQYPEYFI